MARNPTLGTPDISRPSRVNFPLKLPSDDAGDPGTDGRDLNPVGEWSALTTYSPLDLVSYQGSSYTCRFSTLNETPDTLVSWQVNSLKGEDGAAGTNGTNGTPGANGNAWQFDVTHPNYGAVGDGVTDDTAAFQACIVAVEAYAAANGYAAMLIPPSLVYLVQDPSIADVDSLAIPSAPLHWSRTARNIDIIGYGALLKLGDFGVSNSVLRIFGSNMRVLGLTIDVGCDDATLALKGCTAFEVNGSQDEGTEGADVQFIDCRAIGGYFDMDNANQGHEHFLAVGATRPTWNNCYSKDCGWTAFRSAASDDTWINCVAIDHRGNGFRLNEGTTARLTQCTVRSSRCRGRAGFLADAGSTATYPAKRRTRVFMTDCVGYASPTAAGSDPGCALVKLAAADFVHINGGEFEVETGSTSSINYALRLEDNLRKVVIENVQIKGGVIFTPDQFHGVPTAQASAWLPDGTSPYVQWTLPASHPIRTGDTIFIQDSDIPEYNRPHVITSDSSGSKAITSITNDGLGKCLLTVAAGHNAIVGHTLTVTGSGVGAYNTTHTVTAITATTITTNRTYTADSSSSGMEFTNSANPVLITSDVPYTAGSLGSNIYAHEGVDELHIKHATIENDWTDTGSDQVDIIQEGHCRILSIEDTVMRFNGVNRNEKLRGIGWYMPDAGLDLMRFKNVQIIGDTGLAFSGVKPLESRGTDEIQTVTVTGSPTGGSFTLTLSGYGTTAAINWDAVLATAALNMRTALRAITGLASVGVSVAGSDWSNAVFTVSFLGTAGNLSQMTSASSLTGGTPNIAHATTTQGVLSTQLVTSGKTIGLNFTIVNKGTGETYLVSPYQATDNGSPYADRLTLFNSIADATGAYKATAVPSSIAVGWQVGDFIRNSAPGSGARPGWHCIATTAAGSAPSFQAEAALS